MHCRYPDIPDATPFGPDTNLGEKGSRKLFYLHAAQNVGRFGMKAPPNCGLNLKDTARSLYVAPTTAISLPYHVCAWVCNVRSMLASAVQLHAGGAAAGESSGSGGVRVYCVCECVCGGGGTLMRRH